MEAEAVLQLAVLLQLLLLVLQLALPLLAMAILPLLPLLPLPQRLDPLLHRVLLPIAEMMKDGHFTATTETGLVAAMEGTAVGSDTIAEKAVTLANQNDHTLHPYFQYYFSFSVAFIDFSIT